MAKADDRVTRVATDLADAAAAEGARQSRSTKQQLDHWVRVGRAVSSQHSASRRRVEAALAGDLELSELTVEEGLPAQTTATRWPPAASPPWRSTTPASSSSTHPTAAPRR